PGNDAEAAGMVAALGDLDVGEMFWRQAKAGRGVVGNVMGAEVDEDGRRRSRAACGLGRGGGSQDPFRFTQRTGATRRWRSHCWRGVLAALLELREARGGFGCCSADGELQAPFSQTPAPTVEGFLHDLPDLRHLVYAHERVDLG